MSDKREEQRPLTTTNFGSPAPSDDSSLTVGAGGPVLMQDAYLIEKLAHFVRERIPDRVYHVKGGSIGNFEVTADVTQWTKAAFLNKVGKHHALFLRFSIVAADEGAPDTDRDVRGVAIKFYTEEGDYNMTRPTPPVFLVRDPMKFPDFIHSQLRLPDTGIRSNNMQWDFWTLYTESAHQVTYLMSDRGAPRTWRNMNAYSSSTYMWENAAGRILWVESPLQGRAGRPELHRRRGQGHVRRGPRLPPARSVGCDRPRGVPGLAPGDADHAVRGCGQLSVQPLRHHQGLAATTR